MKIIYILTFLFIANAYSAEVSVPCLKKDGQLGLNLEKFECGIASKVVNDPEIKNAHEDKILDVLADKISHKIKRNMEDFAVLNNVLGSNDLPFMKNKNVSDSCNIKVIANSCLIKSDNKKLKKLLERLDEREQEESKQDPFENLEHALLHKFFQNSTAQNLKPNQCPLNKNSGYYILSSQMNNKDLKVMFPVIADPKARAESKEIFYKTFPQLKIILNSGSPEFIKSFEDYISNFDKTKNDHLEYLNEFFNSPNNQEALSKGLENNCKEIKKDIKTFMCNDLSHLAMPEEFAENFYPGNDSEDDIEISKAFSCPFKKDGNEDLAKIHTGNNVHDWFKDFEKNTVPSGVRKNQTEATLKSFCEMYKCDDPKVKDSTSCKKGGPLASNDLSNLFNCAQDNAIQCTPEIKRAITYIESLENRTKISMTYATANSSSSGTYVGGSEDKKKGPQYSTFFQNFVGVEGTLQAEGKKITPHTVAEKVREFEEKKLEPIPSTNRDILLANNEGNKVYNMIKQQKQEEALNQQAQANQQVAAQHGFVPSLKENDDHKQAVIANSLSKFKGAVAGAKKDEFQASREQDRKAEISRMRSELEGVLKEMKGSEEDKLQTITDSNNIYAHPKAANKDDPYKGMSAEERERLENYRSNLATWESRLRARESDVLDRELRVGSRSAASTSEGGDKRFENGKTSSLAQDTAGSAQNPAHAGAGNANGGLKLTKSQTAAGGPQGTTESATAQASGKTADGEAIVAAENLATLEKSTLKKWGLSARDSFVIKVRLLDRLVDVPVKSFTYSGKSMFVPILTKENRELSKLILESPLFSDYRLYQQERQKVLDRI